MRTYAYSDDRYNDLTLNRLYNLYKQAVEDFNNQFDREIIMLELNELGRGEMEIISIISNELLEEHLPGREFIELHGDMVREEENKIVMRLDLMISGNTESIYFKNVYNIKNKEWDEFEVLNSKYNNEARGKRAITTKTFCNKCY